MRKENLQLYGFRLTKAQKQKVVKFAKKCKKGEAEIIRHLIDTYIK